MRHREESRSVKEMKRDAALEEKAVSETTVPGTRQDTVIWSLGTALLLALGLRAYRLGARNLWFDEAWSWYISQQPIGSILEEGRSNIHPPLLPIVLKFWTALFGDSAAVLRFPSLLASVGIVAGVYWLGRQILSRPAALLVAFLLALSPHQVFYAQEARMYALVTALTLGAVLCYVRFLRREGLLSNLSNATVTFERPDSSDSSHPRRKWDMPGALGYMVSGALALYTHLFGMLVLAAVNLHFLGLIVHRGRRGELSSSPWASVRRWALWQLGLLMLYAPWLMTFIYQVRSRPRQEWRPPLGHTDLIEEFFLFVGKMSVGSFVYPQGVFYALKNLVEYRWNAEMLLRALENLSLYPLAIGLGLFLLWRGTRAAAGAGLLQALFFIPLLLISGVLLALRQYMDFGRYLTMITPYYFLLLAAAVMSLRGRWSRRMIVGLLSVPMLLGLKAHYRAPLLDSDYRPIASILKAEWREGDRILVDPAYMDRCLRYELRTTPIVHALPPADLPPLPLADHLEQIREARAWVVIDYRSPLFSEPNLRLAQWDIVSDQRFPSSDPRIRLLLLERRAPYG